MAAADNSEFGRDRGLQQQGFTNRDTHRGKIDWERLGLQGDESADKRRIPDGQTADGETEEEPTFDSSAKAEKNELYSEDQSIGSRPWWKANFFVSEPVLFGTWDGVFTSCMINIFGILIFLRTGWMVGNAGLGFSSLIIFMTIGVALIAVLSAIGVCERCHMESGGVYFLVSHVLGARTGATIGILYCFGQAVACSLCVVGFGESIAALIHHDNVWISRGIAVAVLVVLLGINVAGVKWVIRLQLVLLIILFVAVLDFTVGSFVHTDPGHGFLGYRTEIFVNNTNVQYEAGESFFTVFGVFFPTATGVFAGINMSGDLRNPSKSIPVGTLSAVAISTSLYLVFALILGATCIRPALQNNYMIAEKVSITGFLFLAGLYISSISSGMGGLYGSPRILQSIANDGVIPVIRSLSKGRGANKVPVLALLVISLIALIFIFVGQVNTLGPIVTMPFMLTYAAVDYSHFVLVLSYDKSQDRGSLDAACSDDVEGLDSKPSQTLVTPINYEYGAVMETTEKEQTKRIIPGHDGWTHHKTIRDGIVHEKGDVSETTSLASETDATKSLLRSDTIAKHLNAPITNQPKSFYFILCNPWLSLFGAVVTLVTMFGIQWMYALANVFVAFVVYIYIGLANPGVFPDCCTCCGGFPYFTYEPLGIIFKHLQCFFVVFWIAQFSILESLGRGIKKLCCRCGPTTHEQVVVTRGLPNMLTTSSQLTEDNEDFANRERYHQSEIVKGKSFDDYGSD